MKQYPPIEGVEPQTIFATRVPRDTHDEGLEFPGVEQFDTHQMRAVYEFDDITVNLFPVFSEQDNTWTPVWNIEVHHDGGTAKYGPFDDPDAAVAHAKRSLERILN